MNFKQTSTTAFLMALIVQSAQADNDHTEGHETDITDAALVNRSADCADYVGTYSAMAQDLQNGTEFVSSIVITATEDSCTVISNSVPNHAFNDETDAFAGGTEGRRFLRLIPFLRSPGIQSLRILPQRFRKRLRTQFSSTGYVWI